MSEFTVEIGLAATMHPDGHNPPACEVYLDNALLFAGAITALNNDGNTHIINKIVDLKDGPHQIKVILKDKTKFDTIGNADWSEILEDQLLHIAYIEFDEINLGNILHQNSEFVKQDGEQLEESSTVLGFNGVWSLKFSTPIYEWFLENI